ncbi:MAG: hypothetical protein WKF37_08440 [Bryobacteraceae bacterium]
MTINALGAGNTPVTIPVTLTVSGSALLNVNSAGLQFSVQQGQTPSAQSFTIASTDGSDQPFQITVEPPSSGLVIGPLTGTTGATGRIITVNLNTSAFTAPGTLDLTIVVTPTATPGAVPARLPVKITVTGSTTVTAAPSSLTFAQVGTVQPAAQTVTLSSAVQGLTFVANATQPWITLTPTQGSVPGTLTVGVNTQFLPTGSQPGSYDGAVIVSVSGVTTLTIPVKFNERSGGIPIIELDRSLQLCTWSVEPCHPDGQRHQQRSGDRVHRCRNQYRKLAKRLANFGDNHRRRWGTHGPDHHSESYGIGCRYLPRHHHAHGRRIQLASDHQCDFKRHGCGRTSDPAGSEYGDKCSYAACPWSNYHDQGPQLGTHDSPHDSRYERSSGHHFR